MSTPVAPALAAAAPTHDHIEEDDEFEEFETTGMVANLALAVPLFVFAQAVCLAMRRVARGSLCIGRSGAICW